MAEEKIVWFRRTNIIIGKKFFQGHIFFKFQGHGSFFKWIDILLSLRHNSWDQDGSNNL